MRTRTDRLFVFESGSGPPLVLLHGLASSSRYWETNLPVLTRRSHVVAPDLLGFGRSPKPADSPYTPAAHLAALIPELDDRLGRPCTLVGHSMGAILALHLADARPDLVERLLLVSLPLLGSIPWGHQPDGAATRLHHLTVHTRSAQRLLRGSIRISQPLLRQLMPRLRRDEPPNSARDALLAGWDAYWRTLETVVYSTVPSALFSAVRLSPTLLHGVRDSLAPIAPVRALAAARPDSHLIEAPTAHHNPCYTHPAIFYAALSGESWLRGRWLSAEDRRQP